MKKKVLEVNVDDLHTGGVYSLVRNVIIHNHKEKIKIDIGAIEPFEHQSNIEELNRYGSDVLYLGCPDSYIKKQVTCYKRIKSIVAKNQYNCVHIHADVAYKMIIPGLAAKRSGAAKVIFHSHASGVDGNHRIIKRYLHKALRWILKYLGTNFVACSQKAADWMFPNIEKSEITIIKNGVQLDRFRYDPERRSEVRNRIGVEDELLLGHVGRFTYQKNHEYLIRIMDKVVRSGMDAKLILIGEGPDLESIREMAINKGLQDKIIFWGTSDHINDLFQAMDIFLLPSHFEGLPIVGVEAQAAGLPVIFSDQITKEAKITKPVTFLKITEESVLDWINAIHEYKEYVRRDTYHELAANQFDIQDTVHEFIRLYEE